MGVNQLFLPNVCSRNDWGQVGINSAAYNTGIKPLSACYMASSGLANNIFTKVVCGGTGSYGLGYCMALTSDLTTGADIMVGWGANFAGKLIFAVSDIQDNWVSDIQ
jgi:hypothetical protein